MPFQLQVPHSLLEEMVEQALAERPDECCGLLSGLRDGNWGHALRRFPLVNAAASPTEYLSEPRSMFEAMRAIRSLDQEVLAVYHSHPTSMPVPSRKDRERNFSEEVVNVIISLKHAYPLLSAWWLTATDYRPAVWRVAD